MQTAMDNVVVCLRTLGGKQHEISLEKDALVLQGKQAASKLLDYEAQLQRWILGTTVLEDTAVMSLCQPSNNAEPLQILCLLLPPRFTITTKVVRFSPGTEAASFPDVSVTVTPSMTIEGVKDEIATQCDIQTSRDQLKLVYDGLNLDESKTLEQYRVDPDDTLHLIVPHTVDIDEMLFTNSQGKGRIGDSLRGDEKNASQARDDKSKLEEVLSTDSSTKALQNMTLTSGSFRSRRRCSSLRSASASSVRQHQERSVAPNLTSTKAPRPLGRPPRAPAKAGEVERKPLGLAGRPPRPPCTPRKTSTCQSALAAAQAGSALTTSLNNFPPQQKRARSVNAAIDRWALIC